MSDPVASTRQRLSELICAAANDGGPRTVRSSPTDRDAVREYVDALRVAMMTPEAVLIDVKRMLAQCGAAPRFTPGRDDAKPSEAPEFREALLTVVIEEYYRPR